MDRETIRTEAQRILEEPSADGHWSNTDYNNVIERAQEDFAMQTKCLNSCATFTTDADTKRYSISEASLANFLDIQDVRFYQSSNNWQILTRVARDRLSYLQGGLDNVSGTPDYYHYKDRKIEFEVNTPADKTVKIYYYKKPTALDADDDVSDIQVNFHHALVYYVCWKFCEGDETSVRTDRFKGEYYREVAMAQQIMQPAGSSYGGIQDDTEGYVI